MIRLSDHDDYRHLHYTAPNGVKIISHAACLTHAYKGRLAMFATDDLPGAASYERDEGWSAYFGMQIRIHDFDNRGFNGIYMNGTVEMADHDHPAHGKLISVPLKNFGIFSEDATSGGVNGKPST